MSITVRTGSNASEISGADAFKSQRVVGNLDSDTNVPTFASNHGISLESSVSSKRHRLLGLFGRGFLAKPLNYSDQENYRYLMALDR
ncbi:unnamed protein product [Enterobius vermicularis]|uniref:Protein kinase domain-containing protein n=1 Tax=Enterobius vermicularis TaxID=51028 RepID=A0A0N4V8B2_ENTVE|nr:unnamed protein product [Enterobius vermicularis]